MDVGDKKIVSGDATSTKNVSMVLYSFIGIVSIALVVVFVGIIFQALPGDDPTSAGGGGGETPIDELVEGSVTCASDADCLQYGATSFCNARDNLCYLASGGGSSDGGGSGGSGGSGGGITGFFAKFTGYVAGGSGDISYTGGNVGIGTAAPGSLLEVKSNMSTIALTGETMSMIQYKDSARGGPVLSFTHNRGNAGSEEALLVGDSLGRIAFGGEGEAGDVAGVAGISAKKTGTWGGSSFPSSLELRAGSNQGGTIMVISDNGTIQGVGIGTASPITDLHIVDEGNPAGIQIKGATASVELTTDDSGAGGYNQAQIGFVYDDGSDRKPYWSMGSRDGTQDFSIYNNNGYTTISNGFAIVIDKENRNISLGSLAGTGNDYVCVDASGTLYRSASACI